jgi:hypothetical protein
MAAMRAWGRSTSPPRPGLLERLLASPERESPPGDGAPQSSRRLPRRIRGLPRGCAHRRGRDDGGASVAVLRDHGAPSTFYAIGSATALP